MVSIGRWHHKKAYLFAFCRGCFHFTKIYWKLGFLTSMAVAFLALYQAVSILATAKSHLRANCLSLPMKLPTKRIAHSIAGKLYPYYWVDVLPWCPSDMLLSYEDTPLFHLKTSLAIFVASCTFVRFYKFYKDNPSDKANRDISRVYLVCWTTSAFPAEVWANTMVLCCYHCWQSSTES